MANAIETLFPDDENMKKFADFIRVLDDWFDVFNSFAQLHGHKPLKAAFEGKALLSI